MARQRWAAAGAAALGVLVLSAASRADEAAAVKAIEKLGGRVTDGELPGNDGFYRGRPVVGLYLRGTKVTDAGLKELKELKSLQTLDLDGTQVTDAVVKELKELKSLHTLYLGGTKITGAGLKELKELKRLYLGGPQVTDVTLKELRELKNLQSLNLRDTKVTDAGLTELKELKSLQSLDLSFTKVTGVGLKEIKSLQTLVLAATQVTDAGLKELKELKYLQELNLSRTKITDVGLKELKELESLRSLGLGETKVTNAGVKELQAALPKLRISAADQAGQCARKFGGRRWQPLRLRLGEGAGGRGADLAAEGRQAVRGVLHESVLPGEPNATGQPGHTWLGQHCADPPAAFQRARSRRRSVVLWTRLRRCRGVRLTPSNSGGPGEGPVMEQVARKSS